MHAMYLIKFETPIQSVEIEFKIERTTHTFKTNIPINELINTLVREYSAEIVSLQRINASQFQANTLPELDVDNCRYILN